MTINKEHYKQLLEEEKKLLLSNLKEVAVRKPSNTSDWEGKQEKVGKEYADPTDVADNIEEYESNDAVASELEVRLLNVNAALKRIETDSYGICTVCGQEVEKDRLEANPAAQTCKEHLSS